MSPRIREIYTPSNLVTDGVEVGCAGGRLHQLLGEGDQLGPEPLGWVKRTAASRAAAGVLLASPLPATTAALGAMMRSVGAGLGEACRPKRARRALSP